MLSKTLLSVSLVARNLMSFAAVAGFVWMVCSVAGSVA